MKRKPRILIIDDEPNVCWAMAEVASGLGYATDTATDAVIGMSKLADGGADVVVLDIQLPSLDGLEALPRIKAAHPDVPVVVVTAHGTMETAIAAVQRGAFEYLLKPVDVETLRQVLTGAVEHRFHADALAGEPAVAPVSDSAMIGRCDQMQEVFKQIALVARTDMAVLIQGETGTGKELAARAIHRYSARAGGPFVAVNCSLLSGDLVASELFGHERGAFTGADRAVPGKVELAAGGTLMLDEVGDLSAEAQARLLRFLDNGEFYRVGSVQPRQGDVRIVAATNRPLRTAAMGGQFRRDLFFRVSGVTVELPPLRERGGDLELLTNHFLIRCGAIGITDAARKVVNAYPFPGNVRELRNAVEHASAMAGRQPIAPEHLPDSLTRPAAVAQAGSLGQWAQSILEEVLAGRSTHGFEDIIARWEKPVLEAGMKRFAGNQARLAEALNMHRSTLRKKLREHGFITGADPDES
jgi:two-component system nitrogen regulation response regulator GlnG